MSAAVARPLATSEGVYQRRSLHTHFDVALAVCWAETQLSLVDAPGLSFTAQLVFHRTR